MFLPDLQLSPLLCTCCVSLTELYNRSAIRASKRISNPGCYATSAQMLIAPLVKYAKQGSLPTVFGLSGYSGAGTVPSTDPDGRPISLPKVSSESLGGGIRPYSLTDHIHEREAGYHLSQLAGSTGPLKVAFVPAVAPWFSGIISTLSMPLNQKLSAKNVAELFEEKYDGEKLVKIKREVPSLQDIQGKHSWTVGGVQVHSEGDRVVVVVSLIFPAKDFVLGADLSQGGLDNLLKGAATQCLQVCVAPVTTSSIAYRSHDRI